MTLNELLGEATRSSGRRFFNLIERFTFEPIFKAKNYWYGVKLNGDIYCANHEESNAWDSDRQPKPKKKVTMYSPIYRNNSGIGYFMEDGWSSSKSDFDPLTINPIVGWKEMEVEVDE